MFSRRKEDIFYLPNKVKETTQATDAKTPLGPNETPHAWTTYITDLLYLQLLLSRKIRGVQN